MSTRPKQPEFVRFDKGTPLWAFIGAKNYAAENGGDEVSFTIGAGVEFTPEGKDQAESLAGKRGVISALDLRVLQERMIPAVLGGSPGKQHRHHEITPEEALPIKDEFEIALGMAEILKADKQQDRSGPQGTDLG